MKTSEPKIAGTPSAAAARCMTPAPTPPASCASSPARARRACRGQHLAAAPVEQTIREDMAPVEVGGDDYFVGVRVKNNDWADWFEMSMVWVDDDDGSTSAIFSGSNQVDIGTVLRQEQGATRAPRDESEIGNRASRP